MHPASANVINIKSKSCHISGNIYVSAFLKEEYKELLVDCVMLAKNRPKVDPAETEVKIEAPRSYEG